ncbi:DUF859 domain-containing protein [Oscillospiraceae bacterium OttesenSCG-928-G22]|nr:DUF859 domain-containing protein [Oscillospiraceae bacterium OttesenSCG-928-G22]
MRVNAANANPTAWKYWNDWPTNTAFQIYNINLPSGEWMNAPFIFDATFMYYDTNGVKQTLTVREETTINLMPNQTENLMFVNGYYINDTVTIDIYPITAVQYWNISYVYGTATGTVANTVTDNQYKWTPPDTLINGLAAREQYTTITITARGYLYGTQVVSISATQLLYADPNTHTPYFEGVGIYDQNAATLAVTGNQMVIVQGQSSAKVYMNPRARGSATIVSSELTNGDFTYTGPTPQFVPTAEEFHLYAVDSRGFSGRQTIKPFTWVPYTEPEVIADGKLSAAGTMTINLSGVFFNQRIGAT